MADPDKVQPRKSVSRCPICGRPSEADFRPFCSRRCADADLGRWLTGDYRIPGPTAENGTPEDEPTGEA